MEDTERRLTIDFVKPVLTDIRSTWNTVKPGIKQILRDNPSLTFIPEDVYSECVNERAFLYTSSVGFLVLTVETIRIKLSNIRHTGIYLFGTVCQTFTMEWFISEGANGHKNFSSWPRPLQPIGMM